MVVDIAQIREGGLTLQEKVSESLIAEALAEGHDTGFRPAAPAQLKAELHLIRGGVLLKGDLTARLSTPCNRCLKEVELSLPISFSLTLTPQSVLRDRDELDGKGEDDEAAREVGSFDLETADEELFDGKTIDLAPIVREQVLLALPMHTVCSETCKGLCGMCGQNLNEKACGCEGKQLDPRFAALKNIKLN